MSFTAKLRQSWSTSRSLLCVGLDPDLSKLPETIKKARYPVFEFNKAIVDATADLVCAFKPQIAYYAAYALEDQLKMTMEYIARMHPQLVLILDAKRGDIGSTSAMYAAEAFDRYQADAVTVNPYLGLDALKPFLNRAEKGVIILCRTSNTGAADLQDLTIDGQKLYEVVAAKAASAWNYNGNVGLVIGATYPGELKQARQLAPDMPFLVPGIGAQGGDVQAVIKNGTDAQAEGIIVNSARAILYAGNDKDFAQAARSKAMQLRDEMNGYRQTPAAPAVSR